MDTQQQVVTGRALAFVYDKPSPVLLGAIAQVRAAKNSELLQTVPEDVIERALAGSQAAYAIVLSTYVGNVMRTELGRGVSATLLTRSRLRTMFLNDEEFNEAIRLIELVHWISRSRRVVTDGQDSLAGHLEPMARKGSERS